MADADAEPPVRHLWLYIPDLASATGWATHDADHPDDRPTADALGFRFLEPIADDDEPEP